MACETAPVICNKWVYQSPAMQQWLLVQLLNQLLTSPLSLSALQEAAQPYVCQQSSAKINAIWATDIAENLDGVNTAQPMCLTPAEISGELAYLVCALLEQLAA